MARQARELSPKGLYYIELRGDSLCLTEADREEFIKTAKNIFTDGGKIYGIFISEMLIRMVVKESVNGISAAMKSLTITYARYINKANGLTGKRFHGRFKSIPLESEAAARRMAKSLDDEPVMPMRTQSQTKPAEKKTVKKSQVEEKTVKKSGPKIEEKPAQKPAVKKQNLPSWLL